MHTIEEINARLSAIAQMLDTATGDELTALETEVANLTAERSAIEAENTRRQQLRSRVASGAIGTPAPAAPTTSTAPTMTVEQQEERAFADFIRGTATQMRANEQNFTLANNGALLPTSIARRVIQAARDRCPILAGADVFHVNGTLKIPVYGPKTVEADSSTHDITVAYGADFSELTADAGAFTSVDLTGYLAGALTLVGRSLQNNADLDVVSFVVNKTADKIATFIEQELLVGTENKCTGALSTTNTMNAGSTSAISADNLIDLQSKIKQVYQAGACWTMHPSTWTVIKKLKDGNGKYLVQDSFTDGFPYRLLGKPVYLSDNMPTIASAAKAVLYGDYSGLAVNLRENMSMEILREKYATQHAIGIVSWFELDSKIQDNSKLATLVMSVG